MPVRAFLRGKERDGFTWPLGPVAGGLPSVTSWRQWGMSWASGGFDDQSGAEQTRTRVSERIAGMMHLPPHAVSNEAVFGSCVMESRGPDGFGRILQKCVPRSTYQNWPWEADRFAVEAFMFGVNDIGSGGFHNSGSFWPEQDTMWDLVWANTWRSVIQRCIAGAVYGSISATGASPKVWRKVGATTTADFAFTPKGPGGVGAGSWQFRADPTASTGYGYWWTPTAGDVMDITVPVDYDTGMVAIRHLCPGSYFDGPVVNRDPFGTDNGSAGTPVLPFRTGAEHLRAPSAVTVVGGNVNATVNCQGMANRLDFATSPKFPSGAGINPGGGIIGLTMAMTHVSRHALTPTPGTTQTLRLTVGGMPAGGWYGFDSWEIQSLIELRPIVLVANVADPATWGALYLITPETATALASQRAQSFSDILVDVCAEFDDPGIAVVDIRTKLAAYPQSYAQLVDGAGAVVELSSPTAEASGDGTHPHAIGERAMIEAYLETLDTANITSGRGAVPFAPGRPLGRIRSG